MRWDIFCQVIDNFGDIGVAWRLAADLAGRGEQVRLWVDDARALAWMAPEGCAGVQVLAWAQALDVALVSGLPGSDVWVETFGCDLPAEFVAAGASRIAAGIGRPVWLNLEYLSAEPYVERSHALPSPARGAPVAGGMKWFFYPGFTPRTGGLLREPDLRQRQAAFDAPGWLAQLRPRLRWEPRSARPAAAARLVSLFCYEPAALAALLRQLDEAETPTHLLVTSGRATAAVQAILDDQNSFNRSINGRSQLSISYLPMLTQRDYDHLLWACALNFVRGEDSVVRAIWAGQPFVWQIYPQEDGVHHAKLDAFLDRLQAPASLRAAHHAWNGPAAGAALPDIAQNLAGWRQTVHEAGAGFGAQADLVTALLQFVLEKR
ncbi:hypothetical protein RD110_18910 [Rhodoferax koreense]|uniref:Protein-arginine rhamnosyltransferase n=1 Tax=Rhodoferax koreensis TaxID=1842727 RepID=A0A1P8JZ38_9BURK|nr:elongation factor P maturation arginine rhamnosyltransferase EarP [Rhodoferax koreense]APW39022.1 hypothetical protein RD110_18910 [Rhodoferax koreense]